MSKKTIKTEQSENDAIKFVQFLRRLNPDAKLCHVQDDFLHDIYEQFPAMQEQYETEQKELAEQRAQAIADRNAEYEKRGQMQQIENEKNLL